MFGLAAACAVAGAGAWGLLSAPRTAAKSAGHEQSANADEADVAPTELQHDLNHKVSAAAARPSRSTDAHSGDAHTADAHRADSHRGDSRQVDAHTAADDGDGEHHSGTDDLAAAPAPQGQFEPQKMAAEHESAAGPASHPRPMPRAGAKLTEKAERRRTAEILRADEEFRDGKIASAMKLYGAAIEAHPSVLDPVVQFRWALCAESLGLLDEAAERYQLLADATASPAWKGFARWGLSRVLFDQQKTELAHRIAADLWLNQEQSARLWRSEMLHWHAHLRYRRVVGDVTARLLDDRMFIGCRIAVRPADLLEIAARIHASETAAPFDPPAVAEVPPTTGKSPDAMYAQYKSAGASVYEAITQFGGAAHWDVQWSSGAEQLARTHRVRAAINRGNVGCLLDALCDGPRLMWTFENQTLRLSELTERGAAAARAFQLQSAGRAAREAIDLYREVRWSPYSQLALAHVQALQGLPVAARRSLEDLIANSPKGDLLGEAWFNLGKVNLSENSIDLAIAAFQRCLDYSMGSGLEPIANLYLGRLLLEANEAKRAVIFLRRSLALAATRDRGTAALTLGAAYLLAGQPQNTAEILRSNQNWLDVESTRDAAAFLSCLAQVQGGHDPTRLKYDLRSLMTSISHVRSEQFFGRSGAVLIAMAYRELGLNGEAADICRDAIAHMPPCALRMKLELMLVDELLDRRDFEATEAQLRTIADSANEEVRLMAYERLCALLLERDRTDDAEAAAAAWLKACSTPEQQAIALRGLGRCLQKKGDYLNAALCFSGSMPHGVAIEVPVSHEPESLKERDAPLP